MAELQRAAVNIYEYAVLVTSVVEETLRCGAIYCDHVEAENTFDELKNQWGWTGLHNAAPAPLSDSGPTIKSRATRCI